MSQEILFGGGVGGGGDCDAVGLLNLQINIRMCIAVKHNKFVLNLSVSATCFDLTDRYQPINCLI
jgi:hypothetical protein